MFSAPFLRVQFTFTNIVTNLSFVAIHSYKYCKKFVICNKWPIQHIKAMNIFMQRDHHDHHMIPVSLNPKGIQNLNASGTRSAELIHVSRVYT